MAQGTRFHLVPRTLDKVWADEIAVELDHGGVVDGLMPREGLTVMYGDSNVGKTFVAIDIACHVAAGLPWHGMEVEQGPVVYVAAENPQSVERRVWAWKKRHGVEHLPLLVVRSTINLLEAEDVTMLAAELKDINDHMGRVALTVMDTLARSMVGNENAAEDMGAYVNAFHGVVRPTGSHGMIVHHSGKDQARGARGHSSLRAATDVELEVTEGAVTAHKVRDEERSGKHYGFELEQVELGTNSKGRVVTTCVAVPAEPPTKVEKKAPLSSNQKIVLDCLTAAIVDRGREAPPARGIPTGARGVPYEVWEETAERYVTGSQRKTKLLAIRRSVDALQAKGLVKHENGFCWLPAS
jgi:RecA-family ATPase